MDPLYALETIASRVVTGQGDTELRTDETLGRIIVSNKTYTQLGSIVVREQSLVVWPNDRWDLLLEELRYLDAETILMVLDLYTPPLKSKLMIEVRQIAQFLCTSTNDWPIDQIHKVVGAAQTNAHEYYGHTADVSSRQFSSCPACLAAPILANRLCLPTAPKSSTLVVPT
jgi:hypothetical protein